MLMFPESMVCLFRHNNKALRWGQAFHQYAKLEKIKGADRRFCDKLYEADEPTAKAMIQSRLQRGQ